MIRSLLKSKSLWAASGWVAISQGLAGLLGLATQIIAARVVGLGGITDGFFVVYVVPEAIAGIFLSLALLVVVPRILGEEGLTDDGKAQSWGFALLALLPLTAIAVSTWEFSEPLARLLGPNLSSDGVRVASATLKIIAPSIVLSGLGAIAVAYLQALSQFPKASIGRLLFALGPFTGSLLFLPEYGIQVLSWAALFGSFISTVFLWSAVIYFTGAPSIRDVVRARSEAFQSLGGMIPVLCARVSGEAWWFVVRGLATSTSGGATLLILAQRFSGILNLVGSSLGTVAYPDIVRESKVGTRSFAEITRRRCDQCFASMTLLAWPLAGIAGQLVLLFHSRQSDMNMNSTSLGGWFVGLFFLMAPWATVNGLVGNATWALGRCWSRLCLELLALGFLIPLLWIGVSLFGIISIPIVLFIEWLVLLWLGELLLRRFVGSAVLDITTCFRWMWTSGIGAIGMAVAWFLTQCIGNRFETVLYLRFGATGVAASIGFIAAFSLFWWKLRPKPAIVRCEATVLMDGV